VTDNTAQESDAPEDRPEPSDDDVEQAKEDMAEIDKRYEPGSRQTVVVPGTNGMVTGTAFADFIDESEDDFAGADGSRRTGDDTDGDDADRADSEKSEARDS
jgi:hypothetical protein